jgi:hypothetical protein
MSADWELYVRIRARITAGWDGSNAPIIEDILRSTHSPDSMRAMNKALLTSDPVPYLSSIEAPTLVFYRPGIRARENNARLFASRIANSHLDVIREPSLGPYPNESGVDAMLEFINPDVSSYAEGRPEMAGPAGHSLHGPRAPHGDDAAPGR